MVLEWLKGATGVFSAGNRGAARSPAQARPPARRVRIQEDAKAAAAARVTREKEKARKDTPRKKNQSRAPSSRLKDDFVVDKKVLGEGHYGVVRRCSPRADPSGPTRRRRDAAALASNFENEGDCSDGGRIGVGPTDYTSPLPRQHSGRPWASKLTPGRGVCKQHHIFYVCGEVVIDVLIN